MNIYDFDKTIYDGDSTQDFIVYAFLRDFSLLRYIPKQAYAFIAWKLGIKTKTQFKEDLFSMFSGIDDIDRWVNDFWIKKKMKLKLFYLKQKCEDDLIISASPEFLLMPICQQLGVTLIGSVVDKKTGHYSGENCFGEEKVRRFEKAGYLKEDIEAFYSDSYSDSPLAVLAQKAYLVKGEVCYPW